MMADVAALGVSFKAETGSIHCDDASVYMEEQTVGYKRRIVHRRPLTNARLILAPAIY